MRKRWLITWSEEIDDSFDESSDDTSDGSFDDSADDSSDDSSDDSYEDCYEDSSHDSFNNSFNDSFDNSVDDSSDDSADDSATASIDDSRVASIRGSIDTFIDESTNASLAASFELSLDGPPWSRWNSSLKIVPLDSTELPSKHANGHSGSQTPENGEQIGASQPASRQNLDPAMALPGARSRRALLDLEWWTSERFDPYQLDSIWGGAEEPPLRELVLVASDENSVKQELESILFRLQSRAPRSNRASLSRRFRKLLNIHRQWHNLSLPLVRADYVHALDTWQWILNLAPHSGLALQVAALFHDVERLFSEADERREHLAVDYQRFKDAHASKGAHLVAQLLTELGWSESLVTQVGQLIQGHEKPEGSTTSNTSASAPLLGDADSLSFFSVNSAGYLDYFGRQQTLRKISWTCSRMSSTAMSLLPRLKLRNDVAALLQKVLESRARGEPF